MSDQDLITRIHAGDREAFNALCRDRYAALVSYARLFLKGFWADDVVQDVLYGVWQNRKRLKGDSSDLQNYLLRSVFNRSMNYIRKSKRTDRLLSHYQYDLILLMSDYYSPDNNPVIRSIFSKNLNDVIGKAIDKLPERCREVFTMSYLEDKSNKEISQILGISLSTVENHVYNALKQLRAELSRY